MPRLELPYLAELLGLLTPTPPVLGNDDSLSPLHERVHAKSLNLPGVDGLLPWAALDARQLSRGYGQLKAVTVDGIRHLRAASEICARGSVSRAAAAIARRHGLKVVEDAARYVVSVRFTGQIREDKFAAPEAFDEVWHLTKSRTGSGGWLLSGIQQAR